MAHMLLACTQHMAAPCGLCKVCYELLAPCIMIQTWKRNIYRRLHDPCHGMRKQGRLSGCGCRKPEQTVMNAVPINNMLRARN